MTFFKVLKCAFCPRWSCNARYQIGNRTYYSNLGFVRTECPKKLEKDPYWRQTKQINEELSKSILEDVKKRNLDDFLPKKRGIILFLYIKT